MNDITDGRVTSDNAVRRERDGGRQKKVMKVKMEEMSLMQRKLRTGAHSSYSREEQSRLEEQKKWLDQEMERVLEQRAAAEELEKELKQREEIIAKKEAMIAEKSELEIKKLRSSQVINKDIIMVSSKLTSVEQKIKEKAKEMVSTSKDAQSHIESELTKLMKEREKLKHQRTALETKINHGTLLSTQDDRRLIELDEAVEALDAAIDFKNELISSRRAEVRGSFRSSANNEDGLLSKLASLSANETRLLLARYFGKVIDLKDGQRRMMLHSNELEVKLDEQETVIRDLEARLQQSTVEADRKLTKLQQEYERKIQLLMRRLMEKEADEAEVKRSLVADGSRITENDVKAKDARVVHLEKELRYYKSMTTELKKRVQDGSEINLSRSINSSMKRGLLLSALSEKDMTASDKLPRDALLKPVGLRGLAADTFPIVAPDDKGSGEKFRTAGFMLPLSTGPVRVQRRDLRRLSNEEVILRKPVTTEHSVDDAI